MYLLPLADRLLEFSSALSSLPGQVPTQEVNSAAEGNETVTKPYAADFWCNLRFANDSRADGW
jgi:hypothetical protein